MNNYQNRYTQDWYLKARKAREAVNNHCCLCLKRHKYLEVHHVVYCSKKKEKIAGNEKIGVHIFPLCESCHNIAHLPTNWIRDYSNPVLKNHNTVPFYKQLVTGYKSIKNRYRV